MNTAGRIRLFKAVVILLSVVVSLAIVETVLRWRMPHLGWTQRPDDWLGWSSREYQEFDPRPPSNPEVTRLLFLGDSYLAGAGVTDLDDRFPILLSDSLGASVEVAILASGGWGTDQELLACRQKGAAWKPDIVFLAFCANNDISNILSHHHGPKMLKPYFTLSEQSNLMLHDAHGAPMESDALPSGMDKSSVSVWKHLYLFRWLALKRDDDDEEEDKEAYDLSQFPGVDGRYKRFMDKNERSIEIYRCQDTLSWTPQMGINHVSAYIHEDFADNSYQWRLFERIIIQLRDDVEQGGATLVVMLLPAIYNPWNLDTVVGGPFAKRFVTPQGVFTFRSAEPRDRVLAICRRNGIQLLDPTDEFLSHVARHDLHEEVWPPPHDRHFSSVGHGIVAGITARWLCRRFGLGLARRPRE